ncbi:MAG: hypothetical protein J5994_05150 [Ruminococcus sp.]|nr:hypothetical protein [Ruminococcus sp.]
MRFRALLKNSLRYIILPVGIVTAAVMTVLRCFYLHRDRLFMGETGEILDIYNTATFFDSLFVLVPLAAVIGFVGFRRICKTAFQNNISRRCAYRAVLITGSLFALLLAAIKLISISMPVFMKDTGVYVSMSLICESYSPFDAVADNFDFQAFMPGIMDNVAYSSAGFAFAQYYAYISLLIFIRFFEAYLLGASMSALMYNRERVVKLTVIGAYAAVLLSVCIYSDKWHRLIENPELIAPVIGIVVFGAAALIFIRISNAAGMEGD